MPDELPLGFAQLCATRVANAARVLHGYANWGLERGMALRIDHVCLGTRNIYEGAQRLRDETGLGNYDGGWFPKTGLANRIVPTGADSYIEVEGVVDASAIGRVPFAAWFDAMARARDVFIGWCLRVDTREELEAHASRLSEAIIEDGQRMRPDGSTTWSARVPPAPACWARGVPNIFYFPDMAVHASRLPVSVPHAREPAGIAWLEVGGSAEDFARWVGTSDHGLPLRHNGGPAGLYAVGVALSNGGELVIRRPAIPPVA